MSVPFSDTGNVPEHYDDIMTQCEKNNVPVLLDMAYISLAVKLSQLLLQLKETLYGFENLNLHTSIKKCVFEKSKSCSKKMFLTTFRIFDCTIR